MSIIFVDSCGSSASAGNLSKKYFLNAILARYFSGEGPNGEGVLRADANAGEIKTEFLVQSTTMIIQFNLFLGYIPAGTNRIFSFLRSTGSNSIDIAIDATGHLIVRRGGSITLQTSVNTISANTWYYIRAKFYDNDTLGTWYLDVDGVEYLSGSGDTRDTEQGHNGLSFNLFRSAPNYTKICNIVVMDSIDATATQGMPFNDITANLRVSHFSPTGIGTYSQFTPLSGNNYENVDDSDSDGDTSYNSGSSVGNKDTFPIANIASGASIKAVVPYIDFRLTDAGVRTVIPIVYNGTKGDGTNIYVPPSYRFSQKILGINPRTGDIWSESEFNASEFGYEIAS